MLITIFILLPVVALYLYSCSNSPDEKAQASAKRFLEENLKNPDSYEPNSFSKLDTLKTPDTTEAKLVSLFEIIHIYSVINAEKILEFLIDCKRILNNKIISKNTWVSMYFLRETHEFLVKVWRYTKGDLYLDNYVLRYTGNIKNEKSYTRISACKRVNISFAKKR